MVLPVDHQVVVKMQIASTEMLHATAACWASTVVYSSTYAAVQPYNFMSAKASASYKRRFFEYFVCCPAAWLSLL